jgi:hypothetical protein
MLPDDTGHMQTLTNNTLMRKLRKALRIEERMAKCYKIMSHPIILTGIYTAHFYMHWDTLYVHIGTNM